MARHRKIDVRIHVDEKFRRLSSPQPCAKYLWFYLLTNPDTVNIPGLYRAGEAQLAEDLGWDLKGFRERFQELSREGMAKADWQARLVWIPKAIVYNRPDNPNVIKSWRVMWDEMPECQLKLEAYHEFRRFLEPLGKGFLDAFAIACPVGSRNGSPNGMANQEQEQEQDKEQEQKQEEEKKREASLRSASSPDAQENAPPVTPPANGAAAAKNTKKVHPEIAPTILVVLEDFPRFAGLGDPRWGSWWARMEKTFLSHPGISLADQLGKADAWLEAHPGRNRARTPQGAAQFLNTWISKAVNDACRDQAVVDARAQRSFGGVNGNGGRGQKPKSGDFGIPPIEGWQPNRGGRT